MFGHLKLLPYLSYILKKSNSTTWWYLEFAICMPNGAEPDHNVPLGAVWFGSALLAQVSVCLFVCVEVLWPSQPDGVMSSAVSLPNHMFTGQA